jgi:hypothetical protein
VFYPSRRLTPACVVRCGKNLVVDREKKTVGERDLGMAVTQVRSRPLEDGQSEAPIEGDGGSEVAGDEVELENGRRHGYAQAPLPLTLLAQIPPRGRATR